MVAAGHEIGVHIDTHLLVNDKTFSDVLFEEEIKKPKYTFESLTQKSVRFFTYPYVLADDVIYNEVSLKKINSIGLDFITVVFCKQDFNQKFNKNFIPRYQPLNFTTVGLFAQEIKLYGTTL